MQPIDAVGQILNGRTPPRLTTARDAGPGVTPTATALLNELVEVLTDPEEPRRRANAQHVLDTGLPQVIALACERLVRRLADGPEQSRGSARASLVQFGRAALAEVTYQLVHTQDPVAQAALAEVITALGRELQVSDRCAVMTELSIAYSLAVHDAGRQAITRAVAALRRQNAQAVPVAKRPSGSPGPDGRDRSRSL